MVAKTALWQTNSSYVDKRWFVRQKNLSTHKLVGVHKLFIEKQYKVDYMKGK
jgi:hypothetical protein